MTRKELKDAYKQYRPEMGVFAYICKPANKAYIGYGQNLKGDINSINFRLKLGSFVSKCNLQNDWNIYGESGFEIKTLETLEYDKDETITDYLDELRVLRDFCSEKFSSFEFIDD